MTSIRTVLAISTALALSPIGLAGFQADGITVAGSQVTGGPLAPIASWNAGYSSFGDHGSGGLSFIRDAGVATAYSHACSGPQTLTDPAGGAKGDGLHDSIIYSYIITSDTLPMGTPVTVKVCVAGSATGAAKYSYPEGGGALFDFADAAANVLVNMDGHLFGGNFYVVDFKDNPGGQNFSTGIFGEMEVALSETFTIPVGDEFTFVLNFGCTSRSKAAYQTLADGHASSSVVWGAAVIDADAQIRAADDNALFPTLNDCTPAYAATQLPPPPSLGPCFNGVCPENYYCATQPGDCGGEFFSTECLIIPAACEDVIDPVCGCDDFTYDNACRAAKEGVSIKYLGPCRKDPGNPPEDLNGDGLINGADLGLLLSQWGDCPPPPEAPKAPEAPAAAGNSRRGGAANAGGGVAGLPVPPCPGDLNGDGSVNGADLGLLLSAWTG